MENTVWEVVVFYLCLWDTLNLPWKQTCGQINSTDAVFNWSLLSRYPLENNLIHEIRLHSFSLSGKVTVAREGSLCLPAQLITITFISEQDYEP